MIGTVESVMKTPVTTAEAEEGITKACCRMEQLGVGSLVVTDLGKMVGIVTSRDLRQAHPNRILADAMSKKLITVQKDSSIWEAHKLLEDYKIEHLPVLEGENLVGILTKSDLLLEIGRNTDPLTGLFSSGYIRFIGEKLLGLRKDLSVLLFDLDDFGKFNKEYGHIEGDNCLKIFAKILKESISAEIDFLCRYGGDEFVVLSKRLENDALNWAEQTITSIERSLNQNNLVIRASVGVAANNQNLTEGCHPADILDHLINQASLASTKAKKEGHSLHVVG